MTKKEKIHYAISLLQEAGVDFKIGNMRFENASHQEKVANLQSEVERLRRWETFSKDVYSGMEAREKKLKNRILRLSRALTKKRTADTESKVNASALKSAENALREKDEVIDDLSKEIKHLYDMVHGDPVLNMKDRKGRDGKKPLPTEDDPEEVEIKDALKTIKKAIEGGNTVVIDYGSRADIINTRLL